MDTVGEELQRGRDASSRHAWREAFEALTAADRDGGLTPTDLELLGEAAWWLGDLAAAIETEERAFRAYQADGDEIAAARLALELCTNYGMKGDLAMHKGWHRRAERLLAGKPETGEHGLLERRRAAAVLGVDPEAALGHGRECEAIGRRLGDPTLQALGIHEQARALVQLGKVEEGLGLMEEAVVAAISGDLAPRPTGVIYCNAINICRDLTDYTRAGEWTDAAKRWCERMAVSGFPGICRVRRAEITRLRGGWAEAEREARQAVEELRHYYVEVAAAGMYEIGEIRLRMGDLDAAEDAFRQANELGEEAQPGMAILQLRQGKVEAAIAGLHRALEDRSDRLHRARLLPALVQVSVEAGDLDGARAAADELTGITDTYTSTALRSAAATARGRVLLAAGDAADAARELRTAKRLWTEVDAPYEVAEARALLGLAYRAGGDEEAARLELGTALRAFEEIGAVPDAARLADTLGEPDAIRRGGARRVTRTFLFSDIVGSTSLLGAIGDEAWSDLQRWHNETLRAAFATHGGEEVDAAGDGFFVSFPDAGSAIECAVAIQRRLADHRRSHGFAPRVRIGIHAAEATARAGGYGGQGVHAAARIGGLAKGEEILISRGSIPERCRFPWSDPRPVSLKGIAEPVEVSSIDWRPSPATPGSSRPPP